MALWRCTSCTAAYAVGAPRCPECSGTDYEEDGVPKIHADGSVTDATAPANTVGPEVVDGQAVVDEAPVPQRPALNASTADWADYAVALGHDRGVVEAFTRTELIELVGTDSED